MNEHNLGQSTENIQWLDQPVDAFSGGLARQFESGRSGIHFIMRQLPLDKRATSWIETKTARVLLEAIALTDAALGLLQQAEGDGGRVEGADIVPAARDALACLSREWLQYHADRSLEPPAWYAIAEVGQALAGDPILRPIAHLERLLCDYRDRYDPDIRIAVQHSVPP